MHISNRLNKTRKSQSDLGATMLLLRVVAGRAPEEKPSCVKVPSPLRRFPEQKVEPLHWWLGGLPTSTQPHLSHDWSGTGLTSPSLVAWTVKMPTCRLHQKRTAVPIDHSSLWLNSSTPLSINSITLLDVFQSTFWASLCRI